MCEDLITLLLTGVIIEVIQIFKKITSFRNTDKGNHVIVDDYVIIEHNDETTTLTLPTTIIMFAMEGSPASSIEQHKGHN